MRLLNLTKTSENSQVILSASIESKRLGHKKLWFATPEQFGHGLCDTRMDGFLVGMLFPAMQYGEDIHVDGCVSKKLLFNLNNYAIPLLTAFSPSSKRIKITANTTSSERLETKGVGTGFSGGVDSFCTIYDHHELENDPDYKINAFLFLNVGSHGWDDQEKAKAKFDRRHNYLKGFPAELGLDFIKLDSNLHSFHPWGHLKTDTLTSTSGVLIMQGFFKRYYYATAGFSYSQQIDKGGLFKEISVADCCDPMIAPLLSTESLDFILDGMQMDRTQKTLHITQYKPAARYLNVCVSGDSSHENCSICSKCCRTIMSLSSADKLGNFSHLFDVVKYQETAEYLYKCRQVVLQSKDPFAQGNVELAKKHGKALPSYFTACMVCALVTLNGHAWKALVKIAKTILPHSIQRHIKRLPKKNLWAKSGSGAPPRT